MTPQEPVASPSESLVARKDLKTLLHTLTARAYTLVTQVALLVASARLLGAEGRGGYVAAMTWASMVATLGGLSLQPAVLRRATLHVGRPWVGSSLGTLLGACGLVTFGGLTVTAVAYKLTGGAIVAHCDGPTTLVGCMAIPFLVWEQYEAGLLMATGRLALYNRAQLIGRTFGLIAGISVMLLGGRVIGLIATQTIAQAMVASIGIRSLWSGAGERVRFSWRVLWELASDGLKAHPNSVGMMLIASSNTLVLSVKAGAAITGQFHLAGQAAAVLQLFPQAATQILYGKVTGLGPAAAWRSQTRLLHAVTLVLMVAAGAAALVAPWAIPLAFGDDFRPSVYVFQWLMLPAVGSGFAMMLAPQNVGRGNFLLVSSVALGTGLLTLGLSTYLVPLFGRNGALAASVASGALGTVIAIGYYIWFEFLSRREE